MIDRRDILKSGAALAFASTLPRVAGAQETFAPKPGAWRQFQVVTNLEIAKPEGKTQSWIPLPAVNERDWFQSNGSTWRTNGLGVIKRDPKYNSEMLHVVWAEGEKAPIIFECPLVNDREEWQYLLDAVWLCRLTPHQHDSSVSCRNWDIKLIGFLLDSAEEALVMPYNNTSLRASILVDCVVFCTIREYIGYP